MQKSREAPNHGSKKIKDLENLLAGLAPNAQLLTTLGHGIEKESLRVRPDGQLADSPHPVAPVSYTHLTLPTTPYV